MLKQLYRRIAFMGIDTTNNESISQVKIINCIATLIILMLLTQIPLIYVFWHYAGWTVIIISTLHIGLFCTVPMLNYLGHFHSARSVLMLSFISFVSFSSVAWQINLHFQYFFLIPLFVSPFLYRTWEKPPLALSIMMYLSAFCGIELYWLKTSTTSLLHLSQDSVLPLGNSILLFISALLSSQLIYRNNQQLQHKTRMTKRNLENMLQQTLPPSIVNELSRFQSQHLVSRPVQQHQGAVIFADMQHYTELCKRKSTSELMLLLQLFYQEMDETCRRWGLEKIKTNGDQYIATCGVFSPQTLPALPCCHAAQEMLKRTAQLSSQASIDLRLRIGIASGEITSGFVGSHTTSFDIWGETVNLASRLESHGHVDRIQVCQSTYTQCAPHMSFRSRGKIKLKGIGTLPTYFLQSNDISQTVNTAPR